MTTLPVRFWAKVNKTETCWLWTACLSHNGYGLFLLDRNGQQRAHRLTYADAFGPVPEGLQVDHTCRVRHCVNPAHLQVVSARLNSENRCGAPSNSTSGVRNVTWNAKAGKWRVAVESRGRVHFAGHFDSIEEAEPVAIALRSRLMTNNLADRTAASALPDDIARNGAPGVALGALRRRH